MKVSIITPAYNCEKFIEACMLSVKNQDYRNIEHIIVNDGSKDGTETVIQKYIGSYNVKLIRQTNHGVAHAMNTGFQSATGDVLAWLDADNYYSENIVSEIVSIFEKDQGIDVVYGNIDFVDASQKKIGYHKPPADISFKKALIYTTGYIPLQPAVFFKKEVFTKTGGFDTRYRISGDYEFWLHALKENPRLFYYDKTFGSYTIVMSGISQSFKGVKNSLKEMLLIGKAYGQTPYGKMMLILKYSKGFVGRYIKQTLQ